MKIWFSWKLVDENQQRLHPELDRGNNCGWWSFGYKTSVTYKIVDLMEEPIQGFFYEQELQKAHQETYRIEKVLKQDNKKKN